MRQQLEYKILGAVVSEAQYAKVKFLVPNDFRNYRAQWKIIEKCGGDYLAMIRAGIPTDQYINVLDFRQTQLLALKLVELNITAVITQTLFDLSTQTEDGAEALFLSKTSVDALNLDPISLADELSAYVAPYLSEKNKNALDALCVRIQTRLGKIKELME